MQSCRRESKAKLAARGFGFGFDDLDRSTHACWRRATAADAKR